MSDGYVLASAHIDVRQHRLGLGRVVGLWQVHYMDTGLGHVVYVEEFALRRTHAPDHDLFGTADLGFVKTADQGGNDVGVLGVVVVAGAIKVGRHHAAVVGTVLAVVAFAELDAGNLGHGIGLVGWLQNARQQGIFSHRLGGQFGVDAAGTEEEQFLHARLPRLVDDVGFDHQVLVDELGRVGVVGVDATDLGCCKVNLIRFFCLEESPYGGLVGEIKLGVGAGNDVGLTLGLQHTDDGGANHATVACYVDLRFKVQGSRLKVFKVQGVGRVFIVRIRPWSMREISSASDNQVLPVLRSMYPMSMPM